MLRMNFIIPGRPLSGNTLYKVARGGHIYLTPEAKRYKDEAKPFVLDAYTPKTYRGGVLTLRLDVVDDWYYKNGEVRRIDADNLIKLVQDAVFQHLDLDDSLVFEASVRKVQDKGVLPHVRVRVNEVPGGHRAA